MIKWLCVCLCIHVIPTQQSLTTSSLWCTCICMYLVVYYVYVVNLCLWRHNLKRCVNKFMTSWHEVKSISWRQKMRYDVKKRPWHQQVASSKTCVYVKTRYDVKRFVMTSKMRQVFRNKVKKTLWYQKVCQKYAITSKKVAITSKTCYDIKEFAITSETRLHDILFPK